MPNPIAANAMPKGILTKVDKNLITLLKNGSISPKPLLICSGGTSTRCAANGMWTLDLRDELNNFAYDHKTKTVEVGAGCSMSSLLKYLKPYGRTFPIGLSGIPGIGYILTGGISPLSRSKGLAIDRVMEIKGVWGNGERFIKTKPKIDSNNYEKNIWKGLTGAAPFLAIITNLKLETFPISEVMIWESYVNPNQLSELIQKAERWDKHTSLQWIWSEQIKIYGVTNLENKNALKFINELEDILPNSLSIKISKSTDSLLNIPEFTVENKEKVKEINIHSEVISLLGREWRKETPYIIKKIESLMSRKTCNFNYIASQQLGGVTKEMQEPQNSFIDRQSIWKTWISGSWVSGDDEERKLSLEWLKLTWEELEEYNSGFHLAQLHQHLEWHEKEIDMSYGKWLPMLRKLKNEFDPYETLPSL